MYSVGFQSWKIKNSLFAKFKMGNVSLGDGIIFSFVLLLFPLNDHMFLLQSQKPNLENFLVRWVVPWLCLFLHKSAFILWHGSAHYTCACLYMLCSYARGAHMYVVFMCLRVPKFWIPPSISTRISLPPVSSPVLHTLRPLFWKGELKNWNSCPLVRVSRRWSFPTSAWIGSSWTLLLSPRATFWEASLQLGS